MEKLIEQTQICILICDWTSDDCEESKQFITGKYFIRAPCLPVDSEIEKYLVICFSPRLLQQILLADGEVFFNSGRRPSEDCMFKNSVFSNNNDCSLMICFLSVLLAKSRN